MTYFRMVPERMTKKAVSRIGEVVHSSPNSLRGGYSLIEILLTISILSAGILAITPLFFKSSDVLTHLSARTQAVFMMSNLFADAEERLAGSRHSIEDFPSSGTQEIGGRRYQYHLEITPRDVFGRLVALKAVVSWTDVKDGKITGQTEIRR